MRLHEDELSIKYKRSPRGMAHFTGTGPAGRKCWECTHWMLSGYYSVGSKKAANSLRPGPCYKYKAMVGRFGDAVPANTEACKFWEEHPNPPSLRRSWKAGDKN